MLAMHYESSGHVAGSLHEHMAALSLPLPTGTTRSATVLAPQDRAARKNLTCAIDVELKNVQLAPLLGS